MSDALLGSTMALLSTLGALAAAGVVIATRSLFVVSVALVVMLAMAAAAFAGLGLANAALGASVFGVALAPTLLLGAIVLTGRSAKRYPLGAFLLAGIACILLAAALTASLFGFVTAADRPPPPAPRGVALLLTAIVFVAALASVGLLGYGERGLLGRRRSARP
jgi:hypothetical protein